MGENEKEKELKATPSKKRVNTKEPSIPKKRKRIRPPSPPRISWNSKSSRRTNTSAAVDYFTDQKYEEKNISTSKTKSKTSSIDKKVEKKENLLLKGKRGVGRPKSTDSPRPP